MSERGAIDIGRGITAGVLAGIVGGWVKLKCEALYPPRDEGREAPPSVMLRKTAAALHVAEPSQEQLMHGTMAVHWAMSAVFGGIYGALAEVLPIVRIGGGLGYGLAVWIGAHELAIPAAELSPPREELAEKEHSSEAFSHAGFGVATEAVRSALRGTLLKSSTAA